MKYAVKRPGGPMKRVHWMLQNNREFKIVNTDEIKKVSKDFFFMSN
jgi:hypothetical protein